MKNLQTGTITSLMFVSVPLSLVPSPLIVQLIWVPLKDSSCYRVCLVFAIAALLGRQVLGFYQEGRS